MKKSFLVLALLAAVVTPLARAQSCPNPGQTYQRLEDVRFSDQFTGATLAARVLAAAADLKACNTYGLVVVPSHEPSPSTAPLPACDASSDMLGITVLDLRGGGNGGAAYLLCGTASGYITLSGYARTIASGGNAIAVLGSALGPSGNAHRDPTTGQLDQLGEDDLGEGANVIGVWGQVASTSSPGVYGINYGSLDGSNNPAGGPGVQGDTVNLPNSIGVLGVADDGGTSTKPNRAVEGRAYDTYAWAGWFTSEVQNVVKVTSTASSGAGIAITSDNHNWQVLGGGSTSSPGSGRFSIYNQDSNSYPFHISGSAASNLLRVESDGVGIGSGGTTIKKNLSGSTSWTPGTVNDNATTSATFTISGAAVGDLCFAGFTGITTSGYLLSCAVTSSNSVTVTLLNKTGGQVTLGGGTLRASVWQY